MNEQTWVKILWIALTGVIFTVVSFIITVALEYWNVKAPTVLEVKCSYPKTEGEYSETQATI